MSSPELLTLTGMSEALTRAGGEAASRGGVADGGRDGARLGASERAFAAAIAEESGEIRPAPIDTDLTVPGLDRLHSVHNVGSVGEAESAGDAILGGLLSVRGMFDDQIERAAMFERDGSVTNPQDLYLAQVEVAKLSVLIDVTSKLAGKFTQSTDTLLKG